MSYEPIVSENAYRKMSHWGLSQADLMAAFNSNVTESSVIPGATTGIARYKGYEVAASYTKSPKGQWIIVSCWKRKYYR